jgi:hypothetical protein
MSKLNIISPNGREIKPEQGKKKVIETAFIVYLEKNGGPTLFDVNVKFPDVQTERIATLEDIHRMSNEIATDVSNIKMSQQLEKVLTLREQLKDGKLQIKEGKIVPGPNAEKIN